MLGEVKSCLESNPISARDAQRHPTKHCLHQKPVIPQRLSQTCVGVFCRGMGQQSPATGTGALDEVDLWHKPSRRQSPLTPPQSRQNLHKTGEMDSWRAQRKPCAQKDPGERSSDPTRD